VGVRTTRKETSVTQEKVVIVARLEGRCSHCAGLVSPGDRIEKTSGGWMHEDCPADPPDPPEMRWDTSY
jgi:hypothetical protein